jgi:hypothetical protein
MTRHVFVALVIASTIVLATTIAGRESEVVTRFGLTATADGPFPSDRFTVADATQNTGLRVSIPKPDCLEKVSECEDLDVVNELDGFNLQPRLSIPISGRIDPDTVTSDTVFLVSLESTLPDAGGMPWGTRVGINQVVWDPPSETLHVESDELLDQHTRYVLVVTKDVRGENGKPVKAAKEFLHFVDDDVTESTGDANLDVFRASLRGALTELDTHGIVPKGQVVAASVFTTQSATAVLEKIRHQIQAARPDPADFLLGRGGERTVFALNQITSISSLQQKLVSAPYFPDPPAPLAVALLRTIYPGSIARLAFGKYRSPDYEVHPLEYIPAVATRTGVPVVQATNDIYFNVFLPSGTMPSCGWPVAIFGHGVNGSKNVQALQVASSMAKYGVATIAINAVGHGFGPRSTLTVSRTGSTPITFSAGGRGIDQNQDGTIDDSEGLMTQRPRTAVTLSDGFRQTAVDLMQLARVIDVGVDVDGDGLADLDPSRIYYLGNSLGGGYGTVFLGVEPNVRTGVIAVPFDPVPGVRLGNRRSVAGTLLASRQPPMLNAPGVKAIDGLTMPEPRFDENLPLRSHVEMTVDLDTPSPTTRVIRSPVTNTVDGAIAIQTYFDRYEWVSQAGSPTAYAPHLRKAPLAGLTEKRTLFFIALGDQGAADATMTAIVRAGDLADSTLFYRHDLARAEDPSVPPNPHGFALAVNNPSALFRTIALGAQDMAGRFFFSDGGPATVPEPRRFFEFPISLPLPEGTNFIR